MISRNLSVCAKSIHLSIHLIYMHSHKYSIAFMFNLAISIPNRCPGSGGVVNWAPHIFITDMVFLCHCGLSTNRARVDI